MAGLCKPFQTLDGRIVTSEVSQLVAELCGHWKPTGFIFSNNVVHGFRRDLLCMCSSLWDMLELSTFPSGGTCICDPGHCPVPHLQRGCQDLQQLGLSVGCAPGTRTWQQLHSWSKPSLDMQYQNGYRSDQIKADLQAGVRASLQPWTNLCLSYLMQRSGCLL